MTAGPKSQLLADIAIDKPPGPVRNYTNKSNTNTSTSQTPFKSALYNFSSAIARLKGMFKIMAHSWDETSVTSAA